MTPRSRLPDRAYDSDVPSSVRVEYQFSRSCPSHEEGLALLREVAERARVRLDLHVVEVVSDADAEAIGFAGSPTYVVEGTDIADRDPLMPHRVDTCRAYVRRDGTIGPLPDGETLRRALVAAHEHEEAT